MSVKNRSGNNKDENYLFYLVGLLFVIANAILFSFKIYYLTFLPFLLMAFYLAFFSLDKLFLATVFFAPLSVELSRYIPIPFDISIPTEPLILVMLGMFLLRLLYYRSYQFENFTHPLSLAIIFYLVWLLIATLNSTMLIVSVKFFIVRFWFICTFFFFSLYLFRRKRNIYKFFWFYIAGMIFVIFYTLNRHYDHGLFNQWASSFMVRPFYNDHTEYGAVLAMFIPVLAALGVVKKQTGFLRITARVLFVLFLIAILFSYSRAAWISLFVGFSLFLIILLKIKFSQIVTFGLIAGSIIFMLRHDIVRELEKNKQDSSTDIRMHIRSMSNISSDASNLERINRWKAALSMFSEKPVFGWGPGTYMFNYAPFQYSYDRTIISTNFADGGDAHSEYLGPLSESGLPGMLSVVAISVILVLTGFKTLNRLENRDDRIITTAVLIGLVTYLTHGFLNNFLHSDKAAIPFWGFAAIIVIMDLKSKRKNYSLTRSE